MFGFRFGRRVWLDRYVTFVVTFYMLYIFAVLHVTKWLLGSKYPDQAARTHSNENRLQSHQNFQNIQSQASLYYPALKRLLDSPAWIYALDFNRETFTHRERRVRLCASLNDSS